MTEFPLLHQQMILDQQMVEQRYAELNQYLYKKVQSSNSLFNEQRNALTRLRGDLEAARQRILALEEELQVSKGLLSTASRERGFELAQQTSREEHVMCLMREVEAQQEVLRRDKQQLDEATRNIEQQQRIVALREDALTASVGPKQRDADSCLAHAKQLEETARAMVVEAQRGLENVASERRELESQRRAISSYLELNATEARSRQTLLEEMLAEREHVFVQRRLAAEQVESRCLLRSKEIETEHLTRQAALAAREQTLEQRLESLHVRESRLERERRSLEEEWITFSQVIRDEELVWSDRGDSPMSEEKRERVLSRLKRVRAMIEQTTSTLLSTASSSRGPSQRVSTTEEDGAAEENDSGGPVTGRQLRFGSVPQRQQQQQHAPPRPLAFTTEGDKLGVPSYSGRYPTWSHVDDDVTRSNDTNEHQDSSGISNDRSLTPPVQSDVTEYSNPNVSGTKTVSSSIRSDGLDQPPPSPSQQLGAGPAAVLRRSLVDTTKTASSYSSTVTLHQSGKRNVVVSPLKKR